MESRKAASEEMRLQTTAKNRQRGCRRDVRRQTVPNTCGSDRKSTIADGRQPRTADTTSDDDEAERRRRRASKSAGWYSSSKRYDGAVRVLILMLD